MSIGIQIDITDLNNFLNGIVEGLNDLSSAMDEIGSMGVSMIQLGFRQGSDPWGNAWETSARAGRESGQTLRDTGQLYRSLLEYLSDQESVTWGTNKIYGAIHQFGGTIVPVNAPYLHFRIGDDWVKTLEVNIPARPFLPINESREGELPQDWIDGIDRIVRKHLGIGE